jgi:hypothetical protein
MTKKFLIIFILISLSSCLSTPNQELAKTAKANAASSRINSSNQNSQDLLKELE